VPAAAPITNPQITKSPNHQITQLTVTVVLFDIDGTLVDSNDAHARAWVDVFAERGYQVEFERVRPLIGMGSDKLLPSVSGIDPESAEGQALSERRKAVFKERYLPQLRPTAGAHDLVAALHDAQLTLVVATSAKAEEVQPLLEVAGAADLFDAAGSGDDVDRSKPDPDIVHAALERSGRQPGEAVMIGDTPYDIDAAAKAGVRCIALRCGGWWDDRDLAGAALIADDPADLLRRIREVGSLADLLKDS
jgi:HAD superfamily hydrolase (TIGR01509 family)